MFRNKKLEQRVADLEALVKAQEERLKQYRDNPAAAFVSVPVPQENDMRAYWTKIAAFTADPLYLFYLSQLRREVVDNFEVASPDKAEFYRGQLAAIGQIFSDARRAKKSIDAAGIEQ